MNFHRATVFSTLASIGLFLINIVIGVIEARILGPEELGRFNVFLTTQTIFVTIFAMGIGQSCIYFINSLKRNERTVISTSVKSILPFSFIASLLLLLLLTAFNDYFGENNIVYLVFFCMGTNALLVTTIFVPVLLSKMEVIKHQIVKYSVRIITLVVVVSILLINIKLDVGILILLTGITNFISLVILYNYFKSRFSFKDKIDKDLLKELLRWGIKLSGNNIASILLGSIPVYFLSWFSIHNGFADVGYYSRAFSLLVVGTIITTSLGPLFYAKWSTINGDKLKKQVKLLSMLYLMINVAAAILLIILSSFIIKFLYGNDFLAAVPVLRILALTLIFNGMKEICYCILSSQGVPQKILKNLSVSILILMPVLLWVIPQFGVTGCAWVYLIITALSTLLLIIDVCKMSMIEPKDFFVMPDKIELMKIVTNIRHK